MRDVFLTLVLSLLFGLLRIMPPRLIDILGAGLTAFLFRVAQKDVRRIGINIAEIYGLPPHSSFSRRFCRQVIAHQVQSALEVFKGSVSPGSVTIVGKEEFSACLKERQGNGRGVIIITGHMGSWELVGHAASSLGTGEFYALAKPSKLPRLTKALEDMRGRYGVKVLWTGRPLLMKDMMKILRKGDSLGFVMDQKPNGRIGLVVDFMGLSTEFVSGPAMTAARTGAPVLGVFCMREGPWRYRIFAKPVSEETDGFLDQCALTQKMAAVIEEVVRLYPEQWAWNYRRWNFPVER